MQPILPCFTDHPQDHPQACASDLSLAAAFLTNSSTAATAAALDCAGANDQCAADITGVAGNLTVATASVAKAAKDCPDIGPDKLKVIRAPGLQSGTALPTALLRTRQRALPLASAKCLRANVE